MYMILQRVLVSSSICILAMGSLLFLLPQTASAAAPRVKNVRVIHKAKKKVTLQWKKVENAQKYQVLVMNKKSAHLRKKTVENGRKTTIKKLKPNKSYRFRVRAKVNGEWGRYSKLVRVRTKAKTQEQVESKKENILVGFWGLNGYLTNSGLQDIKQRFHSDIFQVASASPQYTVNTLLPLARAQDMKVTLRMSGSHETYTTNGDFNLEKWKQQIALWEDSGVQEFIDNGTLVGHMILDDISNFSGYDPDAADLEEMARYSKEVMPGLMTFVRVQATHIPVPDDGTYEYVDAIVNQYKASEGDVYAYAEREYEAAKSMNLDVINGLNICDGGDGSSGQRGWRADKYAMSADEITRYSKALLDVPDLKMFLMWEYDSEEKWSDGTIGSDYFNQSDVENALAEVGLY